MKIQPYIGFAELQKPRSLQTISQDPKFGYRASHGSIAVTTTWPDADIGIFDVPIIV
jgi:hypothetical protein